MHSQKKISFLKQLLFWYLNNKRPLPWRTKMNNPYKTLISELMLQQTTVQTVIPYFNRFIEKWPTLETLSKASLEEILSLWQGLGYYTRAKNLFRLVEKLACHTPIALPETLSTLASLPGIGPYTSSAIYSIGMRKPALAVDGNVARVLSRIFQIKAPKSKLLPACQEIMLSFLECLKKSPTVPENYGDYTQSFIELGALVCVPKKPLCHLCPVSDFCQSFQNGTQENFPQAGIQSKKQKRFVHFFWAYNASARSFLMEKESESLLQNLYRPLRSPFCLEKTDAIFPFDSHWSEVGSIAHIFTHFSLEATQWFTETTAPIQTTDSWISEKQFELFPTSTLIKKAFRQLKTIQAF